MTKKIFWLAALSFGTLGAKSDVAFAANSHAEAFTQGFLHPLRNMNHLLFIMMAGILAYCIYNKRFEILLLVGGTLIGAVTYAGFGSLPGATLISGLSVVVTLLALWLPQYFAKWSWLFILVSSVFHGTLYGKALGTADGDIFAVFCLGALFAILAAYWGTGFLMFKLKVKSESSYETIEHLFTAVASGVALVFTTWGVREFFIS